VLVIEEVDFEARVELNGAELGVVRLSGSRESGVGGRGPGARSQEPGVCPARFEITSLLKPRNELLIDVTLLHDEAVDRARTSRGRAGQPGGLIGEVRLEICD
jgi:hypothetical protein